MIGKGIFIHQAAAIAKGNPEEIACMVANAGFRRVDIKVCEGGGVYSLNRIVYPGWGENLRAELVAALKRRGIAVWGWGFCYGKDPQAEANAAIAQCLRFKLDGYILDVEQQFEGISNPETAAHLLASKIKRALPEIPLAFCSWALWKSPISGATWHNIAMARAFLEHCDYGMPMMYWPSNTSQSALQILNQSLSQWQKYFGSQTRIAPIGRAYTGDGGVYSANAIETFANQVKSCNLPGISWWSMDQAWKQNIIWSALTATPGWSVTEPGPGGNDMPGTPSKTVEERLAVLESEARVHGWSL